MKKIIVIGCPGSGKTTFAKKLSEKNRIPLFHLDSIWHNPDGTHISRAEFDIRLAEIMENSTWIIDGNYSRTLEMRLSSCDTVFLFDLPVDICLEGAISRLGKKRPDFPCLVEELDSDFKQTIEQFPQKNLPTVYSLLEKYSDKDIIIFKNREDADFFLTEEKHKYVN